MRFSYCLHGVIALAAAGTTASANTLSFSSSLGSLAASVSFEAQGSNLVVTLTNTATADVLIPADVLTSLYWDTSGASLALVPLSAVLNTGSNVVFGSTDPGNVVGGEWAYASGLGGAPQGAGYGISSSGFNLFGDANFPGTNLQGPTSVDGLQYGITSAGDNTSTGNTPVTGTNALIQNSVVFTLSGLPAGFDPEGRISNIVFQYGTALTEPHHPAPGSAALLVVATGFLARRRRVV